MMHRDHPTLTATHARRAVLTRFRLILMCAAVMVLAPAPAWSMDFMSGVDISALTLLEDNGAVYSDNGVVGNPVEIFTDHDVNWVRLRLFLEADGEFLAVQDFDYTLHLAQRIKADAPNIKILLDFHYSDTWADPGKQFKPGEWIGHTIGGSPDLLDTVHNYTRNVVRDFKDAGVMPDMVQIGNEISNGMIWDDGRLWKSGVPESVEFDDLAALISAGINGANAGANDTSGSPAAPEPLIMIHTDKGGDEDATDYWLDRLLPRLQANGTDPDVIGLSYYPLWHYDPFSGEGDLAEVQRNMEHIATPTGQGGHGKPSVIVETGFASSGAQWEPDYEWEVSEAGQAEFFEDLIAAIQAVPNGMGWGAFWWYAEAIPTPGLPGEIWNGGRYGLFDEDGDLLPAIDAFPDLPDGVPGDIDGDGDVDLDDFDILSANYNSAVGGGISDGDLNGDGFVTMEDFVLLAMTMGPGTPGETLGSVPEPAALAFLSLAGLVCLGRRR